MTKQDLENQLIEMGISWCYCRLSEFHNQTQAFVSFSYKNIIKGHPRPNESIVFSFFQRSGMNYDNYIAEAEGIAQQLADGFNYVFKKETK